jgi:predicted signal transduction protein with EAL and GGDEF domain
MITEPIVLARTPADGQVDVGVSIGVAIAAPGSTTDLGRLLALADEQLYHAKQQGKGGYELAYG